MCFHTAIANGDVIDNVSLFRDSTSYEQRNLLLRNDGTGKFKDVGPLSGPGFVNTDFSLIKRFRVTERVGADFRAEVFNLFNHAQFGIPTGNFLSGTFGVVTIACRDQSCRIGQVAVKILFCGEA